MFFMRGSLFAVTGTQTMIDARQQELELAAIHAREQENARRREREAAKRGEPGNVVSLKR